MFRLAYLRRYNEWLYKVQAMQGHLGVVRRIGHAAPAREKTRHA